jgi:hypothetical protein
MAAKNMEPSKSSERLVLGFGLTFADLYDRAGLERLDAGFLTFLNGADADLHDRLIEVRRDSGSRLRTRFGGSRSGMTNSRRYTR